MNLEAEQAGVWSVGLTVREEGLEIHAVNSRSEVILEGWFPIEAGLALVCGRPACVIAIDEETLPTSIVSDLAYLGHSVVVVPPTTDFWNRPTSHRRAKDIHDIGVTLLEVMN
ncbi:hypothetical protein [Hyphomicrobium sp. 99]|uniref:hypothetical protein n=1 Tax=Hyphomicrobium sp. 99 TaxID=1163419 RepID=UPI0005F81193|nr:hypothetical protein [Hyphomicrobium sp. 99]